MTKAHIASNAAQSLGYTNTQLAEGILAMMDFDHQAHDHLTLLDGSWNAEVSKMHSREIDYVHNKFGSAIRSAWDEPTPTEEEITYELAEKDAINLIDSEMEKLNNELEKMNLILGKR